MVIRQMDKELQKMEAAELTGSILALQAAGQEPEDGPVEAEPGECCLMCARLLKSGEHVYLADNVLEKKSFTNWSSLALPYQRGKGRRKSSAKVCRWCREVMRPPWTQKLGKAVIDRNGVWRFSKNCEIAHWLLCPPEPPFMMAILDQKQQHIWWRTPINWDRRLIRMRLGEKLLTLRPEMLRKGLEAVRTLSDATSGRKQFQNPYVSLSRDMGETAAYHLREEVESLRNNSELGAHVRLLDSLTPGEVWAVSSILPYAEPCEPEKLI